MDACEFFLEPSPELVSELALFNEYSFYYTKAIFRGRGHSTPKGDEVVGFCTGCGKEGLTRIGACKRWSRHLNYNPDKKSRTYCGIYKPASLLKYGRGHSKPKGDEVVGFCTGCGKEGMTRMGGADKKWTRHLPYNPDKRSRTYCGIYKPASLTE